MQSPAVGQSCWAVQDQISVQCLLNTEEAGPRYQWKCFTNDTVANELNFMGINLEELLQCTFD